ncbi:uncharacterized protein LOC142635263 [Castanea sativa]|uniref:uncharacterized protein LOC142635263 n=1 Tax=Castanea sativa TaxID=21020 RepID=UPI003F6502C8
MHQVLVDNGSSADILYYPAFQQMGIGRKRLVPKNAPLIGFGGARVYPFSAVTLTVTVGDYPQQITKDMAFLMVDCSSAYNAILGQLALKSWKAVTSIYHLMIKFHTEYGRVFASEQDKAIAKEVQKLQEADFIREVYCPDWLANVVMVKKVNGKWRMCVDFTDLNRACPKDSYPLSHIDTLVDSTARHELLSFMDAFSGYNQIKLDEAD